MDEQACLGCLRALARTARPGLREPGSVTGTSCLLLSTGIYTSKGIQSVRRISGEAFSRNEEDQRKYGMEMTKYTVGRKASTYVGIK